MSSSDEDLPEKLCKLELGPISPKDRPKHPYCEKNPFFDEVIPAINSFSQPLSIGRPSQNVLDNDDKPSSSKSARNIPRVQRQSLKKSLSCKIMLREPVLQVLRTCESSLRRRQQSPMDAPTASHIQQKDNIQDLFSVCKNKSEHSVECSGRPKNIFLNDTTFSASSSKSTCKNRTLPQLGGKDCLCYIPKNSIASLPPPAIKAHTTATAAATTAKTTTKRSSTCVQQAANGCDDVTIDELASYFDTLVHIPKKMSSMAEMMYI